MELIDRVDRKDIRFKADPFTVNKMGHEELNKFKDIIKETQVKMEAQEQELITIKSKLAKEETLEKLETYEFHTI